MEICYGKAFFFFFFLNQCYLTRENREKRLWSSRDVILRAVLILRVKFMSFYANTINIFSQKPWSCQIYVNFLVQITPGISIHSSTLQLLVMFVLKDVWCQSLILYADINTLTLTTTHPYVGGRVWSLLSTVSLLLCHQGHNLPPPCWWAKTVV